MAHSKLSARQIHATVLEVLPATGLAFAADDAKRTWGITRSTPGAGLGQLRPGQRLELTVINHADFDLVSYYTPLGESGMPPGSSPLGRPG